jgi:hypothetical protein
LLKTLDISPLALFLPFVRDVVDKKPFSSIGFVLHLLPHIFGRGPSALGPVFLENIAKPFEIRNLASDSLHRARRSEAKPCCWQRNSSISIGTGIGNRVNTGLG